MKKIYKFYANWCMPCKMLSMNLEGFEKEGWEIEEINADTNLQKMVNFGVRKLPTMVITDAQGEVLDKIPGVISQDDLKMRLNEFDKGGDSTN